MYSYMLAKYTVKNKLILMRSLTVQLHWLKFLHTNSEVLSRRIGYSMSSVTHKISHNKLEKNAIPYFEPAPQSEILNKDTGVDKDIFGIESDEGAICFDDASPQLEKFDYLLPKRKSKNVGQRTSFGTVRLDNSASLESNKFLENIKSLKKSEVRRNIPFTNQIGRDSTRNISQRNITNDPAKVACSEPFSKKETKGQKKALFENLQDKDVTTENIWEQLGHDSVPIYSSTSSQSENYDHSPEKYDINLTENDEINKVDYMSHSKTEYKLNENDEKSVTDSIFNNCKVSEVDKQYFSGYVEQVHSKFSEIEHPVSDLPEIDQQYFTHGSSQNKLNLNISEFKKNYDIKNMEELQDYGSELLQKRSKKTFFINNEEGNKETTDLNEIDKQYFELNSTSPKPPASINNVQTFNKKMTQTSNLFDSQEIKDTTDKNLKNISTVKNSTKIMKNSKAFEYVEQLRKEKDANSQKSGTYQDGIKLDSKGFRILTNQVPNFSSYTRDELMAELKTRVIFADDDIVVLNKPYNLIIHEAENNKEPSLSDLLQDLACQMDNDSTNPKLITVHRLDKTTTGCLLLARNEMAAQYLKSLFAQRKIVKKYWIVTNGVPDPMQGVIDMPIVEGKIQNKSRMVLCPDLPNDTAYKPHCKQGKKAITQYSVISVSGNAALIEAKSETGLKHQIRVHFGFGMGCPIIGDHKYSYLDKLVPQKLPSDILQRLGVRQSKVRYIPMHIHARSIVIPNYSDGRNLFVNAPLPDHMRRNLQSLKFRKK